MAKDPAFLFYPGDWLGGTMGMTFEEKGAYLELLVMQWNCHRIAKAHAIRVVGLELWQKIAGKFSEDKEGFYNKRLDLEVLKRKQHSDKQRINAKKRWDHLNNIPVCDGIANAMPLENENINENEIKDMRVQGEKDLSNLEIGNTVEYIDRLSQKKLSHEEIKNYWQAFLLNGQETAYLTRAKKIQHFRYWLKKQSNGHEHSNNGKPKLGTSDARIASLKKWGYNDDGTWGISGST